VDEERQDMRTAHLRFDLDLLADRLLRATDWIDGQPTTRDLRIGYFGASTGSAAALMAAAERPERVYAIVSRGGRPDLAASVLPRVQAPTPLNVRGGGAPVIEMNPGAPAQLPNAKV